MTKTFLAYFVETLPPDSNGHKYLQNIRRYSTDPHKDNVSSNANVKNFEDLIKFFFKSNANSLDDPVFNKSDNATFCLDLPHYVTKAEALEEAEKKWIENSFYRLNVYFSKIDVEKHIQIPLYTINDLGSNLGGAIGLWIGVSVLTIIEVLSSAVHFCAHLFNTKKKKVHNQNK